MPEPALPARFVLPERLDLTFEGFPADGFGVLARLRATPRIEQVRLEKDALDRAVTAPFKRYRDDLAVNWVLPNGLPFETERGVFSRILKNDFGAGGAHHHLWMAFYRTGRTRLRDVQLSHAVEPDGFRWGLYAGAYAGETFRAALDRLHAEPEAALALVNALIARGYRFSFAPHVSKPAGHPEWTEPLAALPDGLARAKGLWLMRRVGRDRAESPGLVADALAAQAELWPLYRFLVDAETGDGLDDGLTAFSQPPT